MWVSGTQVGYMGRVLGYIAGVMGYMAGVLRCLTGVMGGIAVHSRNDGEYCGA